MQFLIHYFNFKHFKILFKFFPGCGYWLTILFGEVGSEGGGMLGCHGEQPDLLADWARVNHPSRIRASLLIRHPTPSRNSSGSSK